MPGIFISYRREDSAGHTGRLFDRLRTRLGDDRVFMDVAGIEAGVDFVETIEHAIGSCEALLAVIGPEWLRCADADGRVRLQDPSDFNRIEIAAALKRGVRVIPVLIGAASMPTADELPDNLKALARRQAAELRDTRWDADTSELIAVLEGVLAKSVPKARGTGPEVARDRRDEVVRPLPSRRLPILGALTVVAVISGTLFWIAPQWRVTDKQPEATTPSASAPESVSRAPAEPAQPASTPSATDVATGVKPPQPPAQAVVPTRVPRIIGLTLTEAGSLLRKAGLAIGSEESSWSPGVKPFVITRQIPEAGAFAPDNQRVNVVYAPPLRTVPDFTGRTLDDAVSELRAAGIEVGRQTAKPTDTASPNVVVEQTPLPGRELEPGRRVDLVYTAPPPPVSVPNVVGLDVRIAASSLQEAGLAVSSRRYRSTAAVPAGQVVSQNPAAATAVAKGTGVALVYASRRGLKVPSVINLPISGAIEVLQRSGFEYQVPVGVSEGIVTGQSLQPGTESTTDKPIVRLSVAPRRAAIDAGPVVVLDTAKGRIELEMYPNEAPKTVAHILALVRRNFYNGQHIHRVAPGFVVQFGDPLTRDLRKRMEWGTGGSGKPVGVSEVKHLHKRGSVALAHRGDPNSGDSQMYIAFGPQPRLDTNFTVFGQVILGMDVAQKLEVGDEIKRASVKGEASPRK